tara:strand:+ start:98 stop:889 length:792 start_codon:yes stop_codon:yes gene_type:complete
MQQRLFTVGCSLTRYHWPTWADILSQSFDSFENWGNRGAGNKQILERFSELVVKNDLTKDDTIIVQWTNYHRFDQHQWDTGRTESWFPAGNVFQEDQYDPRSVFIRKMWYEESYIMHTWNYIHVAAGLANTIDANVLFVFGADLRNELTDPNFKPYQKVLQNDLFVDKDIFDWSCATSDDRLSFYNTNPTVSSTKKQLDYHPTPIMYYKWLDKFIAPKLGINIDKSFAEKMQTAIEVLDDYNHIGKAILATGYDTNNYWQRGY